jgi:large subunit ribosomal protein L25
LDKIKLFVIIVSTMVLSLKAEKRSRTGKLTLLRKEGLFPAVFYGKKEESTPIQIKLADFLKVHKNAGESTVVTIDLGERQVDALINDVSIDPVSGQPVHADFYVFEKGQKVEIAVPLEFVGTSAAVKELGGVLVKSLHEIKIEAEPSKLPQHIEVDIESLKQFGDVITAGQLKLPAGVALIENTEEIVASVSEPKEEVVEEAPVDLNAIEVEKKGKTEEEGEAAAE